MAPSPENDNAPKAPDKGEKTKGETSTSSQDTRIQDLEVSASGSENKEASVSTLDDAQLKALLDEAVNYKIPKDRVGKSKLFQNLLEQAEEDDRKARATSASGSESVRYYNTAAAHRTRRSKRQASVSETIAHGGSLNNLAKEELYAGTSHLHRPSKTVSSRALQGGSLPCNVNAGIISSYDKKFFEETPRKMESKKPEYTAIDMESESLLEHDSLNQDYNEQLEPEITQTRIPRLPAKYTSRFNLEIGGGNGGVSNVDDALTVSSLERISDKVTDNEASYKAIEATAATSHYPTTAAGGGAPYSLLMPHPMWPFSRKSTEDKRVDENGNALAQAGNIDTKKNKKKKIQTDKNVVVLAAKDVAGHRYDIIDEIDKLVQYIRGTEEETPPQTGAKSKSNMHKTKFHKQHFSGGDDKNVNKKQRARTKVKTEEIQKSNSMEEISISKLGDFNFTQECDANKVPLRVTKSNVDRPRERRSWGNSESLPLHASAENLETADFRVVTKKKKSKKTRNSVSSRRQTFTRDAKDNEFNRVPSSEERRKSVCSVPHSDKSNDSSDVDSLHSLPIDTTEHLDSNNLSLPISYADIAKNSNSLDRPKWNRPPSERKMQQQNKTCNPEKNNEKNVETQITNTKLAETIETNPTNKPDAQQEKQPSQAKTKTQNTITQSVQTSPKNIQVVTDKVHSNESKHEQISPIKKSSPPDVHNIQNWPAIPNHNNNNNKNVSPNLATKNNHNAPHKAIHNKNLPPNNIKNNLKNSQYKTEKLLHHQQQQHQQQQYIPNLINRGNNSLPNNINVEAAVQMFQNSDQLCVNNVQLLPHNIPDVQTIEKMHFKQLQAMQQQQQQQYQQHHQHQHTSNSTYVPHSVQEIITNHVIHTSQNIPSNYVQNFTTNVQTEHQQNTVNNRMQCLSLNKVHPATSTLATDNCDSDRTSSRPAVVILSGDNKEVSGITFGFDINEQLLSDDVCDNFTARFYVPPDIYQSHNHDKIVNFIGQAWEDTINTTNGKVKYYSEHL